MSTTAAKELVGISDSDEQHKTALKAALEAGGYEVVTSGDGGKLLNSLTDNAKRAPAFVVIDVKSSGVAGLEAARRFASSAKFSKVPVIMMAQFCSPEDNIEAQSAGAIGCLQKPVGLADVQLALIERKQRDMDMKEQLTGKFKIGYE